MSPITFYLKFTNVPLRHHTLVLDSSGKLWAFGNGASGQIDTGQPEGSLSPALVQLPWTTDSKVAVPKGKCGWQFCSVLLSFLRCNGSIPLQSSSKFPEYFLLSSVMAAQVEEMLI